MWGHKCHSDICPLRLFGWTQLIRPRKAALRSSQCQARESERLCCLVCSFVHACVCWGLTVCQMLSQVPGPSGQRVSQMWPQCLAAHTPI